MFFYLEPSAAVLSDCNRALIETYQAIKQDWRAVLRCLKRHRHKHSARHYYRERERRRYSIYERAAQFIYLNRACWNGLYRVNREGKFNVPKGTKDTIIFDNDDFEEVSHRLQAAQLECADFEETISEARNDDLIFIDPPYTTAHNYNGFRKYNQQLFSWHDQLRLNVCIVQAINRGATVIMTNAAHESVEELYANLASPIRLGRESVISGAPSGRIPTSEFLYVLER